MRDRVDASVAGSVVVGAIGPSPRRPPRSRRLARLLIVVLALVWTQFPFGSGGASAEGDHELALCCAWGRSLDDGNLTYSISSPDGPSGQVIRTAIRDWDRELPALTLTEVSAAAPADVTIRFTPGEGRTEGQAVTSFTKRGLISKVEITIQGARCPGQFRGPRPDRQARVRPRPRFGPHQLRGQPHVTGRQPRSPAGSTLCRPGRHRGQPVEDDGPGGEAAHAAPGVTGQLLSAGRRLLLEADGVEEEGEDLRLLPPGVVTP